MKRFLARWLAVLAAFPVMPAMAATIGPRAGVYNFGTILTAPPDFNTDCKPARGFHFDVFLGSGGISVNGASSVLRSSGTGAVKFSTSLPFDWNAASADGVVDTYYGFWAIMTFNEGSDSTGTITFDHVIDITGSSFPHTISFSNYTQNVNRKTGKLTLDFIAGFPGCNIEISGTYEQ